ncbi:hypothetical protein GBAR_LOCUS30006 [Geodia barretti]|uniref:MYND-type domain-containing protein n=1 Tax=Geodia barretti TaxID=519541 RepID=A0AA35XKY1_GEOBA|nr:hypothetical protein GBAR_LOCUS30006 [Geodia barretti]
MLHSSHGSPNSRYTCGRVDMSKLNDLDNADGGIPFPPSRLLLHDHVQMYYSFCRAAPEDVLSCVTGTPRPLVLLLAPGDTRSLLYTLYRNFDPEFRGRFEGADFLMIENWSLLQARDILMLHLCLQLPHKIENEEGRLLCAAIWAIFYSVTLRPPHVRVLKDAVTALSQFTSSLEAWASPENPLGKIVKFRNQETFTAVAGHWRRWSEDKPNHVPYLEFQQELRFSFLSKKSLFNDLNGYTEQCVTYLLGLCSDSVPMKTQQQMREEFSAFLQKGVTFAEDMLQLPVGEDWETTPNVTLYDGTSHTKIHNPFYALVPFLGFFHSLLFSPSGCRDGNIPRSLCDKLPVTDDKFESQPILANCIQQLILWLSASSRALRKFTVQASPCMTFTFECSDPISLCLRVQRNPELYTSSLGVDPSFDLVHSFECVDGVSPPDLVFQAVPLLKDDRCLIVKTVDHRSVGSSMESYLGSLFGLHPQIFPVMFGFRSVSVDGSFSDCTVVRHSAWNQEHRHKSYDVRTLVFQRVLSTPYVIENLEDIDFAPKALVSVIHGATYNFPVNRFAHMMSMETVIAGILAFVSQMEEDTPVHRWQFWDDFVQLVKVESTLEPFLHHLQTVSMLHGLHLHVTVTERDCPVCRYRPLSSYLSFFSLKIEDPVMVPHMTIGLFIHRDTHNVDNILVEKKETYFIHALALRQDEDGQFFVDFYFPKLFVDDSYKLTLVKFSEENMMGQLVQVPVVLYQGLLKDCVEEVSRYSFYPLPKRRPSMLSAFGKMRVHVAGCEKVKSIIDIPPNLVYRLDCNNLMVDSNQATQMHLCLKVNEYCRYDIYFPYPVVFSEMKVEFHCREDTVTITARRDYYSYRKVSPLFLVTPTNRLFLPAAPVDPPPSRNYLALQLSPLEEDTLARRPMKLVPPIIKLKYILRDLFKLASSRCRFVHVHTTKDNSELSGMIVIHDEVVDLDTRSPAIDLSFCFLKDGEDKHDLVAAWGKISADHMARTLFVPHENLEHVTKMFEYYARRTHTVYTENNRTSLCRIKVLRKNNIEVFFTRAVVFPMYASPDQQIDEESSEDDQVDAEIRRIPHFMSSVTSRGGVPINDEVKKVIEALSPSRKNSEERRRGATQVSLTTQAAESAIVNTLFEAIRDAQSYNGSTLFHLFAGLPSGTTVGSGGNSLTITREERLLTTEYHIHETTGGAAAKPTPKPREPKESREKLREKMREKMRAREKVRVRSATVKEEKTKVKKPAANTSQRKKTDAVKTETKPLRKEPSKKDGVMPPSREDGVMPPRREAKPPSTGEVKPKVKPSTNGAKPSTKGTKPLMEDEAELVTKKQERKASEVKPAPLKKPLTSVSRNEEKESGREESGRKTDAVNSGALGEDDDSGGGKHKHKAEGTRLKGKCTNCGKSTGHMKKCASCGRPRYCSRECQKQHWKVHKPDCIAEDKTAEREGGREGEEPATRKQDVPRPLQEKPTGVQEKQMTAVAVPGVLKCTTCGRNSDYLKRCKCVQVFYCDIECQRKDWPHHKLTCSAAPGKKAGLAFCRAVSQLAARAHHPEAGVRGIAMQEPNSSAIPYNFTVSAHAFCNMSTCSIAPTEVDKRDAITVVRVLVSLMSIFGSLSIIVSILWRRILCSPKIVQCVTVVLTVTYAVVAYRVLKRQELSDMLAGGSETVRAWAPWKMTLLYMMAWFLPAASVLIIFGIVASRYSLVEKATDCSCWCLPFFINIVPVAYPKYEVTIDLLKASGLYFYHTKMVVLASSVILLIVYFFGFATLVIMYWKILRHIRRLRESAKSPTSPTVYGSVGELLMKGHSQAKKRVLCFLSAFVITGLANVVLCAIFVAFEAGEIHRGPPEGPEETIGSGHKQKDNMDLPRILVYSAQSLTAPLQGFVNALVYGWTRDDFVKSGVTAYGELDSVAAVRIVISCLRLLPMVLVMLLFAVVVTDTDLLQDVNNCSCWCRPSLGNIIPSAKGRDPATIEFRGNMRKLVVAFAAVIGTHFLAGFIILIIVYGLMIRTIRRMRERNATRGQGATGNYGAVGHALTEPVLERAEFQAKRRVTYFLIVFMVTGFFNLILCVELMFFDIVNLGKGEHQSPAVHENRARAEKIYYVTLCLQTAVWDTIASLRMIISCLSLLGASSIIGSAIKKREVGHPKVLPIFSLAVADLGLALLWIIGGALWLRGVENRQFCFIVSLLTVVGQPDSGVCLCLLLIIKKTDLSGLLAYMDPDSTYGWSKIKTVLVYSIAWCLPAVIVLGLFGVVAGSTNILQNADICSCWCAPVLSNVMPYAVHIQQGTAEFVHNVRKLLVAYGAVITTHFLVGLVALVTIYHKCLKRIRQLKNNYDPSKTCCTYGSEGRGQRWALISKGESKARKRVFCFLTAFILSGFFNFIFTIGVMAHEIDKLRTQETLEKGKGLSFKAFYMVFATLQALSITQQGFLNAIVYGWTRENFLHIMAFSGGSSSFGNVQRLMLTHGEGDSRTASGELGETWAVFNREEEEEEEEEEKEEEERGKWTPTQTQSLTPALTHKLF